MLAQKLGKSDEEIAKIKIENITIDNYWSKEKVYEQFLSEVSQYYFVGNYYKLSIAVKK